MAGSHEDHSLVATVAEALLRLEAAEFPGVVCSAHSHHLARVEPVLRAVCLALQAQRFWGGLKGN